MYIRFLGLPFSGPLFNASLSGRKRFGSVPDVSELPRSGSVRKEIVSGSTRFGLRFSDASWLGPVPFRSASGSGQFWN